MDFLNKKKKNEHQKNSYKFSHMKGGIQNKVKVGIMKFNKKQIHKI